MVDAKKAAYINGNRPAHPRADGEQYGLSKREHFAAMALQGVIFRGFTAGGRPGPEAFAKAAVQAADALLVALEVDHE